jgi:[lysine-biosynthesis-protein LysW]--L-2-aminoadipate ligase
LSRKTGENNTPQIILLFDTIRWEEKEILKAAENKGLRVEPVDTKKILIDILTENYREKVAIQRCVSYFRGLHLSASLESLGCRVINSFNTSLICGNKLFVSLKLKENKIPTPKTYVAFDSEGLEKIADRIGFPFVIKPVVGSWGRLSSLIKDRDTLNAIVEHREYMFPLYQIYYVQEYVDKPGRDIRTFVLGERTIAAIYRVSSGDWRTNTARGGKAIPCKITGELDELSVKAAKAVGGDFVGVDIMESKEGLLVHEVNSTTEFKNTVPATGIDIPSMFVDYISSLDKR